jgi:hypothetical protein
MDSEKLHILEMIDSGELSVQDALRMMSETKFPETESVVPETSDVELSDAETQAQVPPTHEPLRGDPEGASRWLRVRVSDMATGANRVSVNLPLGLMRWGLAVGSRFVPDLHQVDMDSMLSELDAALLDLDQISNGRIVEVEDEGANQRVEIFVD